MFVIEVVVIRRLGFELVLGTTSYLIRRVLALYRFMCLRSAFPHFLCSRTRMVAVR